MMNNPLDLLDTLISNPKDKSIMIRNKLIKEVIKNTLLQHKLFYRVIIIDVEGD